MCRAALIIVVGFKRRLIGVERDLGIDHQLLLPRHVDDGIGPQPPVIGIHRLFEVEIGVLRQPALFEQVLQRPFPPAAARLGRVGERIAQPLRLAPHFLLPQPHPLDLLVQRGEGVAALAFELADLQFVLLQAVGHRLEQPRHRFLARLFRMAEPFGGIGE